MLSKVPAEIQKRIVSYLLANNFPAAKALYDAWMKTCAPLKDPSGQ